MAGLQWHHFHTVVFLLGCRAEGVSSARLPVGLCCSVKELELKSLKLKNKNKNRGLTVLRRAMEFKLGERGRC